MADNNETVWVTEAFVDSTLRLNITTDIRMKNLEEAAAIQLRNESGEPLPQKLFPKEVYAMSGLP
jgi:hypothetical protein